MMHQKALLFSDYKIASEIMCEMNPKKTKALGRRVRNFDHDVWEQHKERIVEEGSYYKFMNCLSEEDLKAHLLATGDRELVEASMYDRIWGIGFNEKYADVNRGEWGLNLLGKALMRARERIKEQERL